MKLQFLKNSQIWILLASSVAGISADPSAWAITSLKKVQVTDGSQIDFFFDGKINPSQIKTEFQNDIIQLSLEDVSVYPAKIFSVSGMELTKVFAYQYAPKLVRCRLTVKGKAEDYQGRVVVKANGKTLTIRLAESSGATAVREPDRRPAVGDESAKAVAHEGSGTPATKVAVAAPGKSVDVGDDEEKALLDRVLRSSAAPVNPVKPAAPANQPLAGGKPLPSPLRSFAMLGLVIGLFGLLLFAIRKIKGGAVDLPIGEERGSRELLGDRSVLAEARRGAKGGLFGNFFGGMGGLGGGFKKKGKLIEMVATHHIGPKKNITVMRVCGRLLVLGVSNDAINLITELPSNGDAGSELGDAGGMDWESLILGDDAPVATKPVARGESKAPSRASAANPEWDREMDDVDPLLTRLGAGAKSAGQPRFADLLGAETGRPHQGTGARIPSAYRAPATPAAPAASGPAPTASQAAAASVRAQIRSRMEGMKTL